jgi:hypothetical protein
MEEESLDSSPLASSLEDSEVVKLASYINYTYSAYNDKVECSYHLLAASKICMTDC